MHEAALTDADEGAGGDNPRNRRSAQPWWTILALTSSTASSPR